jgi:hypothetical protein
VRLLTKISLLRASLDRSDVVEMVKSRGLQDVQFLKSDECSTDRPDDKGLAVQDDAICIEQQMTRVF